MHIVLIHNSEKLEYTSMYKSIEIVLDKNQKNLK